LLKPLRRFQDAIRALVEVIVLEPDGERLKITLMGIWRGFRRSMPRKAVCSPSNLMESTASPERCPEQYRAVVDCCAFVNWRRIEVGEPAVLALSYYRSR
jgi:hypothetical protein